MSSVRSCWKFPPYLIQPVPAGSKMDPPLAKAEPISDAGSASVITYLRRERKKLHNFTAAERRVRCERNSSADSKVSEEGGGEEVLQALEQRLPCSP